MSVIPLRPGIEPAPNVGDINPQVVELLTELLEKARAGEVVGVAFASLHPGDLTTSNHGGRMTRGVIGALTLLQHDMCKTDIEAV